MPVAYIDARLAQGATDTTLVKALQRDLRTLGYLRRGIDGSFGSETHAAVCRLQFDLVHNDGRSTAADGAAPVALRDFNKGRVSGMTGVVDPGLAACIDELLAAPAVVKLPNADDPKAANAQVVTALKAHPSTQAPTPFMLAMFTQESNCEHFRVPAGNNADNFVTVGLDVGDDHQPFRISSRGYGIGQYTIFHHPPHPAEVADFILDPARNVSKAHREFREKFDGFVNGPTAGTQADDRIAEHGTGPLRLCKFPPADPRFLRDCVACTAATAKLTITAATPVHRGSSQTYGAQTLYPLPLAGVPNRADFECDWPYAARRYNGGGPLSYNYQARILRFLLSV